MTKKSFQKPMLCFLHINSWRKYLMDEPSSLKSMTDDELWLSTIKEVEIERNSTLKVINLLQEISLRHLHLKRGYSSLHEFCVKVLKYSDGGAYRRIKAMKLVRELPETIKSIETGSLNLTTASQIQQVFESKKKQREPLAKEEKLELFRNLEGKSKREVERAIAAVCPEVALRSESQKSLDGERVKKTLVISERLHEKIEKLKKLRAHENKDFVSILEDLVDRDLKRVDPLSKSRRTSNDVSRNAENRASPENLNPASDLKTGTSPEQLGQTSDSNSIKPSLVNSRYISAKLEREVWTKCDGQCDFVDPKTGKKCSSTYFLQIDHIAPYAKGGPTTLENLRLLCANHNQLLAKEHFG